MTLRFDIEKVRSEVISLLAANPELADDQILRLDMVEGSTSFDELTDRLGFQMVEAKAQREAARFGIKHYEARDARYERAEDALKLLAGRLLDLVGAPRKQTKAGTFYEIRNSPAPVILNEDALPEECFKVERKPSMTKIREYMEANGGQLPAGVAMSNGGRSVGFRK